MHCGLVVNFDSINDLATNIRQATASTNIELLTIGILGINFNEILIKIIKFSLRKMSKTIFFFKDTMC